MIPIYFQWMASEDRKTAREDARLDAEATAARKRRHRTAQSSPAEWGDFRPSAVELGPRGGQRCRLGLKGGLRAFSISTSTLSIESG